jgi:predicted phage terminase large subunit-like protein
LTWAERFFPHYFEKPSSDMHRWLSDHLHDFPDNRGSKLSLLAPRGNAKSTWGTLLFPLYCAIEGHEPYIWIVSDTIGQSESHLESIGAEILENDALREAYPAEVTGAKVSRGEIRLGNGCKIQAFSTGQKVRGRRHQQHRPSLIILDDPQNDEHVISPDQRDKQWTWFTKALLKAGTLQTNVVVLGTALHRECIACRLLETAGWEKRKFQSIVSWPSRMDLWAEWENVYCDPSNQDASADARAFFDRYQTAMEAGAEVLWPDHESLYDLMRMRAEEGHTSFSSEKQNDPINPEACEFPEEYFASHIWFDGEITNPTIRLTSLDPSKGRDTRLGDYSAIISLEEKEGILYIDADMKRRPTTQMITDFCRISKRLGAEGCAIETNQYQELLLPDIEAEVEKQGFVLPLYQMNNLVNKRVRIRRIEPYLAQRRLRFRRGSPGAVLLVNQLKDFPIGDHDDGPDALEMAIRLGYYLTSGQEEDGLGDQIPLYA